MRTTQAHDAFHPSNASILGGQDITAYALRFSSSKLHQSRAQAIVMAVLRVPFYGHAVEQKWALILLH